MEPIYRYFEIAIYAILNFFPFVVLAIYPFWNDLRFSRKITYLCIGILTCLQILTGILAATSLRGMTGILSLISTGTYLLFYFIVVKAHWGKKVFVLLILSNIANLSVVVSKFLESRFSMELALQSYRYSYSICMFVTDLIICVPAFIYIRRLCNMFRESHNPKTIWNYLWLVPATFYLIWFYHLYNSNLPSLQIAMQPDHVLWLTAINAGAILIYFIIFKMIFEMKKNEELSSANQVLEIQKLQYYALDRRIRMSRQARHDLRHHFRLINTYLKDEKYDELKKYLADYQAVYDDDTPLIFCEHYAVNALFSYYMQQAKSNHIRFDVSAQIPKNLNISDVDLTVLLSNLMENAFEACIEMDPEKSFIHIKGKMDGNLLFIRVENSNAHALYKDENDNFYSTKHKGAGIGTLSVKEIVRRYHGKIQFQEEEGLFSASLIIPV